MDGMSRAPNNLNKIMDPILTRTSDHNHYTSNATHSLLETSSQSPSLSSSPAPPSSDTSNCSNIDESIMKQGINCALIEGLVKKYAVPIGVATILAISGFFMFSSLSSSSKSKRPSTNTTASGSNPSAVKTLQNYTKSTDTDKSTDFVSSTPRAKTPLPLHELAEGPNRSHDSTTHVLDDSAGYHHNDHPTRHSVECFNVQNGSSHYFSILEQMESIDRLAPLPLFSSLMPTRLPDTIKHSFFLSEPCLVRDQAEDYMSSFHQASHLIDQPLKHAMVSSARIPSPLIERNMGMLITHLNEPSTSFKDCAQVESLDEIISPPVEKADKLTRRSEMSVSIKNLKWGTLFGRVHVRIDILIFLCTLTFLLCFIYSKKDMSTTGFQIPYTRSFFVNFYRLFP